MLKPFLAACLLAAMSTSAVAQTLERIKENGELRIGFRADAPPLSFVDTQGRPAGYTPTLCAGVARGLMQQMQIEDLQITFVSVGAGDRFEKVAAGEIDLHCGAATITLRRSALVDFSIPVYVDGTAVMLPQGASSSFAALAGEKVGVRANTTTEEALTNTLADIGIDAEVVSVDAHPDGVLGLQSGELKAYFADQSILLGLDAAMDTEGRLQVMDKLLTIEKQGLALARGDADFRLAVNTALSQMYASGAVQKIFAENLPGARPGLAIEAMYLLAPTLE